MINDGSRVIPKSLISAIERNLESEEQERVSADMRIRKSQVNVHVLNGTLSPDGLVLISL